MEDNNIILKPRELHIKTLENKEKVVQIKSGTAFDEQFIAECEEKGVKEYIERSESKECKVEV